MVCACIERLGSMGELGAVREQIKGCYFVMPLQSHALCWFKRRRGEDTSVRVIQDRRGPTRITGSTLARLRFGTACVLGSDVLFWRRLSSSSVEM